MKSVSMVDFRLHAEKILTQVQKGQKFLLTRRGKPIARLEPVDDEVESTDPIYLLGKLSVQDGGSLDNAQIDEILYGQ
jgi:prevent-host-death family protein